MITWLVAIITLILALFIFWRARSAEFRKRCEEPKYRFLEQLGVSSPQQDPTQQKTDPQGGSK